MLLAEAKAFELVPRDTLGVGFDHRGGISVRVDPLSLRR